MNIFSRKYPILLLLTFLIVQCNSSSIQEPTQRFDSLPVLEYKTLKLIGADDNYIPGMISKIFQLADGSWVVADHGSTTIEHFTVEGQYIATVAIQGEGPGEVKPFFFFHQFSDSVVVARQQSSNRLDFYTLNHEGELKPNRTKSLDQGAFIWSDLFSVSPHALLGVEGKNWLADNLNYDAETEYYHAKVMSLDFDLNVIRDSVTTLRLPNPRIFRSQGGVSVFAVPLRSHDRILPLNNGSYWIIRGENQRFERYNHGHDLIESFELSMETRPVESDDIVLQLGRIQGERRNDLASRIPSTKPLFINAWADVDHILLHTDASKEGREYVVIEKSGNIKGRFMLPNSKQVQLIHSNNLVVFNYDRELGYSVEFVTLDL